MTLRLPRGLASPDRSGAFDALQYEILQETAATLARLGRRAESALAELAAFDAARSEHATADAGRDALVTAAGEAVWHYAVQREVLGLGDTETLLRELHVPREVRLRMGVRPSAP
jgi:hypothetical protein